MRGFQHLLLFLSTGSVAALRPIILADTNRDGVVDAKDSCKKSTWTSERGAIFLPNIGDKGLRCSNTDKRGEYLSNDELSFCSDASGHLLLAPEYLAPIRTLPLNVSRAATAQVYATPQEVYKRVRIFYLQNPSSPDNTKSWRLVDQELSFNASSLAAGLTLGIDGRELIEDTSVWDGSVTVVFKVTDGSTVAQDSVALKLAPVLTHHHLQPVDVLVSTAANNTNPIQVNFLSQLEQARVASGIATPMLLFNQSSDIWAQDFFEPAYASMPGPSGPISIRIMLRSAQSTRTGGRQVFEQLRGPGVGGYQHPSFKGTGFGHREINSFGNLETIPPYTSKAGVEYKAGRIIMGKHYDAKPAILGFLYAQGAQSPLVLEAGWLLIGHVDEFVQFLPYNNSLGWTIGIADTVSAMALLQKVKDDGHGDTLAISSTGDADEPGMGASVTEMLSNATFVEINQYAQKKIDANLAQLLAEIPLDSNDVIRVPTLFRDSGRGIGASRDGLPPHTDTPRENEWLLMAFNPASINGIVLGKTYVSPTPFGPVVNGVDMLAKGVEEAYARAGMTVVYVDDFLSHHMRAGEVHCGSNTLRKTTDVWW